MKDTDFTEEAGGAFRGVAAAIKASVPAIREGTRVLGQIRFLAFASEGGVAAKKLLPRLVYLASWGLSGAAVVADIATRTWDSPKELRASVATYFVAFHIPASLLLPAIIIHKVVHFTEGAIKNFSLFKALPSRAKSLLPAGVALFSIVPVVPAVDHSVEYIMEPTLGKYLGLKFYGHKIEKIINKEL
ncbi:uncharacterized protein LOC135146009 [Zophobas morio]|uniref:uncharacterized protein LOC135146009 n=1 Tax=Zophobas morio TaxID=2755281 RepID=UPI0030833638